MTTDGKDERKAIEAEHSKRRDMCLASNVSRSGFVILPVWDEKLESESIIAFRRSDFVRAESFDNFGPEGEDHDGDPWSSVFFMQASLATEYAVRLSVTEVVVLMAETRAYFEK